MISARRFWRGLAFVLTLSSPAAAVPADAGERINILFIISDDHRWNVLGVAGDTAVHTPALDRLYSRQIGRVRQVGPPSALREISRPR